MRKFIERHALLLTIGYALFAIACPGLDPVSAHAQNMNAPIVGNPLVTFNPNWYFAQWQCADGTPPAYIGVGNNVKTVTFPRPALNNSLNGICANGQPVKPAGQYEPLQYIRRGWNIDITHPHQAYWDATMRYTAAYPAANGYRPFVTFGGPSANGVDTVANPATDNAANIGYIFNASDLPGGSSGEQAMFTATQFPDPNASHNNYLDYFNAMNCGDAGMAAGGSPNNSSKHVRANGQWGDYPISFDGMNVNQIYSFPSWSADITIGSQGGSPDGTTGAPTVTYCTNGSFTGPSREKWGFFIRPLNLLDAGYQNVATVSIYLIQWEFGGTIATSTQAEVFLFDYLLGYGRFEGWCQADSTNTCQSPGNQQFSIGFSSFCPQIFMFPSQTPDPWLDNPGAWPTTAGWHWQMIGCMDFSDVTTNGVQPGMTAANFFSGFTAPGGHSAVPGDTLAPFNPPPE